MPNSLNIECLFKWNQEVVYHYPLVKKITQPQDEQQTRRQQEWHYSSKDTTANYRH